jgi:Cep120 protein
MKSENLPVKIDCFALKNFKGGLEGATREHIGYILVPVKTIPLVSPTKAIQMKPRWMKLIGLSKDWRSQKPELQLNIIITSKDFLNDRSTLLSQEIDSANSIVFEEHPCMISSQKGIFIRLLKEEGLLQVGNIDTDCDVFIVNITMMEVRHLETVS